MDANKLKNCIDSAADKLIAAHDGDVALLYLYIMRTGSEDMERAACELCRTMNEISAAREKLQRMGLLDAVPPVREQPARSAPLPPAEELPQYRAEDIVLRSRSDGDFAAIVTEAQQVLGHTLSSSDLTKLFGIYDYLAIPAEVLMMLLHHCADEHNAKYGSSRRLSMRYVEKEAYIWADREILTLEQAEEHLQSRRLRREKLGRVMEVLRIRGRELSPTEHKYISSWLDMGFEEDALALAYDRTVTNTGSLKWPYMNKVLLSWHEKKLHSAAEVEEKEGRGRSAKTASAAAQDRPVDIEGLRSDLGRL